jgi:hypothetical protein
LLVMARVCDLLSTLSGEARTRVVGYVNQRMDSLPTMSPASGAGTNGAEQPSLLEDATDEMGG